MKLGENMFQMTVNKHAKFHGDRTIGGSITVKKASKHSISKVNALKLQSNVHNIHLYSISSYHMIDFLILNNFSSRITAVNQIWDYKKKKNYFCELALSF